MIRERSLLLFWVLLAAGVVLPVVAAAKTMTLQPTGASSAEAPSGFTLRPFPHLLMLGEPPAADLSPTGNARVVEKSGRPTVLADGPRLLSDWGEDPLAALAKERAEAEPETIRILGLRIDFLNDSAGDASTGDGRFDLRSAEEAEMPIDPPPHNKAYFESHFEALQRYYEVQSQGNLVLEYDVFPAEPDSAYHLPDTDRYGPWIFSVSSDSILARAERFVRESVMLADSLDQTIDWKRYQSFIVFHAGSDFQSDVRQDTNYDIPSFNLFLGDSLEVYTGGADSVMVNLVMVIPETVSQDDFLGALNGVIAHEFGHQLGFFDLYDVYTGLPVVGVFSLMDSGDGQFGTVADPYHVDQVVAVRGLLPASLDPWHKLLFFPDGVDLVEPDDGEEATLDGVALGNEILYLPVHLSEYFLAENRPIDYNGDEMVILRADPNTGVVLGPEPAEENPEDLLAHLEYDYLLPGSGVILWHIDEFAAVEGLVNYGGLNIFSDRRGVDVEEADGIQDIGTASPEFLGGPFDPYFVGGFTRFGPETVPDSRTNDGTETGISIEVLDPPGLAMRIAVGNEQTLDGWPLALLGAPIPDGLNRADLDGDGLEEILLAIGTNIVGITADGNGFADGGERYSLAALPDTLEQGPVVAIDGAGFPTFGWPVIATEVGGIATWFDALGTVLAEWPPDVPTDRVSAGPIPVASDSLWILGTSGGDAIGLIPREGGLFEQSFLVSALEPDTIVSLAAGRLDPGALMVAYGTSHGAVGLERPFLESMPPELKNEWTVGTGPVRDLLLFRAPIRFDEDAVDLVLASTEGGSIDLRQIDGTSVPGWPVLAPDTLAGHLALGDPDGDGLLEVVATTRSGEICQWSLDGTSEPHWPMSVWHPDQFRRPDCTTGPRLWDLGMDGTIEIVQLRGDGIVIVLEGDGQMRDGWPYASGSVASDGPLRLIAPDGSERWYLADALSDSTTAVVARPLREGDAVAESTPGSFPEPGVDVGRTGVYPVSLVPTPQGADRFFDSASLILHPNPVRGSDLQLRYVLGEEARIRAQLFDVSGREKARAEWEGHAGLAGETQRWDLSALASGTYVVRIRIDGANEGRTVVRTIAVVR